MSNITVLHLSRMFEIFLCFVLFVDWLTFSSQMIFRKNFAIAPPFGNDFLEAPN